MGHANLAGMYILNSDTVYLIYLYSAFGCVVNYTLIPILARVMDQRSNAVGSPFPIRVTSG